MELLSELMPIAAGVYLEALAIDGSEVWVGDVIGGGVVRVGSDGCTTWLADLKYFSSLALNSDGKLLRGGVDGIGWFDPASGRTGMLLTEVDGLRLMGVNELCPDGLGGLYFGTKDGQAIMRGTDPRPSELYHLAVDGAARQLCGGLAFTNGLVLSDDRRTLFHNETFVGTFAYPVLDDGSLGERVRLLDKPDADGLIADAAGNLLVVGYRSSEILHITPQGDVIGEVRVPAGAATNARFGGDGHDLYVTSVPFDAGERIRRGAPPTDAGSVLYRGRTSVQGRVQPRTDLTISG